MLSVSIRHDIEYARSGDVAIAYQVVGDGPVDLVFVPFFGNVRGGDAPGAQHGARAVEPARLSRRCPPAPESADAARSRWGSRQMSEELAQAAPVGALS